MKTFLINENTLRNVKNENTFQTRMIEIANHWNKIADESNVVFETATTDAERKSAERKTKACRSLSKRVRALSLLTGECATFAINMIQSASRNLVVYDCAKIATLAEKRADSSAKLNAGCGKALRSLSRANVLDAESISVTDINRTHAFKNDTRSSLLLFVKMNVLEQIGRSEEIRFRVKDRGTLEEMIALV